MTRLRATERMEQEESEAKRWGQAGSEPVPALALPGAIQPYGPTFTLMEPSRSPTFFCGERKIT